MMEVRIHGRGTLWLLVGLLLLLGSSGMYVYDLMRSDERILQAVEQNIQADFAKLLRHYQQPPAPDPLIDEPARACFLTYDASGRLQSWTGTEHLPGFFEINNLKKLGDDPVWKTGQRAYYRIEHSDGFHTRVILLPLRINYNIQNEFLVPYWFLGRYQDLFSKPEAERNLMMAIATVGATEGPVDVTIRDLENRVVLSFQTLPVAPFRQQQRILVLVLLGLAIFALSMYLRIYALSRWNQRYLINFSLFFGLILFRMALWLLGLPGDYLDIPLFSANVLAFSAIAPSLGEFTLNVFTLAALVWILYLHVFRLSLKLWRRLMNHHYLAWIAMIGIVAVLMGMAWGYTELFFAITDGSQIDLQFSNVFSADLFSFLVLLDVGLLFLVFILLSFTLLKFNVIYGERHGFSPMFWLIHLLAVLVFGIASYQGEWKYVLILGAAVVVLLWAMKRIPYETILQHDMINYLLIIGTLSLVVTVHFADSQQRDREQLARQIADGIIGKQVVNTVAAYDRSHITMKLDERRINETYEDQADMSSFRDWLLETYFVPRLKDFDLRLYAFDSEGNRLDEARDQVPAFTPQSDIAPGELGDSIAVGLYQLLNTENRYVDFFVGVFPMVLGSNDSVTFYLEMLPNSREDEGLYPALTMEQSVYDQVQRINRMDHAIYQDGILYNERGSSPFPVQLANYQQIKQPLVYDRGDYFERVQAISDDRHVIVRYPKQQWLDLITTFSFIFYFFVLASIVVVGIPVLIFRSLRSHQFTRNLPLRAKIRFGLLTISVLPMIFIMVLLSPFIYHRYEQQAQEELLAETERVTRLISPGYLNLRNDPFSRMTLLQSFEKTISEMGEYLPFDVNIYDEEGKPLTSSRPLIFDENISSDLMNDHALALLTSGQQSDAVLTERIGNKEYFSGYRSIIGKDEQPIGFVNVPYLTKQEELDEQVIEFLAYLANIYLVVFLLINVVAVLVSSTISQPLRMIQERLAATGLGARNEQIQYAAKDEIGAIVSAYNQMIVQLENKEEKIKQNQRELAWRQMARQVAHEIKNPLTPMRLSIQHLSRAWDTASEKLPEMFPRTMKTLMSQIDSMVRIANSFTEFAKMPEATKSRVEVGDVLRETVDLFSQTEEILWLIDLPNEPFFTFADRDQLSRCFSNLIKNAIQAIPGNGVIEITMRLQEDRATIEVKDNGSGMSEEVQAKVFEPSFSTKNSGMGLGLAMVKKIIEHAGGDIHFESQEGEGTTFFVELPAMETPAEVPVA